MAKAVLHLPSSPEKAEIRSDLPKTSQPNGPNWPANAPRRLAGALLKRKASTLFRHFPDALAGDEEAIHQLRIAGRRLRAALPLLVEKAHGRRVQHAQHLLRRLTRCAGSSRDLDVLLVVYDQRLKALPARTPEQKVLRQRLASARRRSRARMVEDILDLELSRLRKGLASLAACNNTPPSVVCERFGALCERQGQRLRHGFVTLGARLNVEALHGLRRRARRLRYAVEVFDQIRNFESNATKPWKLLQDLIGGVHDHHVLAIWFDEQAKNDAKRGNVELATAASAEADWARDATRQLHDEFLKASPIAIVARGLLAVGHTLSAQAL